MKKIISFILAVTLLGITPLALVHGEEEQKKQEPQRAERPLFPRIPELRERAQERPVPPQFKEEPRARMASSTGERPMWQRELGALKDRVIPMPALRERIQNADGARLEIEKRLNNLGMLDERLKNLVRVKGIGMGEDVTAYRQKLESLREEFKNGSSTPAIGEFLKAARGFALVVPKAAVVAAADRALAIAVQMDAFSDKLSVRIDAAEAAGVDVSEMETSLEAFDTAVSSAKASAQAALNVLESVTEKTDDEQSFADSKEALKTARDHIKAAHTSIQEARSAAHDIATALRANHPKTEAE